MSAFLLPVRGRLSVLGWEPPLEAIGTKGGNGPSGPPSPHIRDLCTLRGGSRLQRVQWWTILTVLHVYEAVPSVWKIIRPD